MITFAPHYHTNVIEKSITDILFFLMLDIDECKIPGIKCTQGCSNSNGGYKCKCFSGYKLEADGFTCTGIYHFN